MSAIERARKRLARRELLNRILVMLEGAWGQLPRELTRPAGRLLRRLPGLRRYGL